MRIPGMRTGRTRGLLELREAQREPVAVRLDEALEDALRERPAGPEAADKHLAGLAGED